ncbi:MAG TPA: hemolysin III family protein [Candidatus Nanoarchaeia archaeon]|nr:hemolysin III family protein [Candidatus Nanoarchaeia archaeon]
MKKILFQSDNEPLSALTHFIGILLSIAGLVLLVVYASIKGDAYMITGFSIFGASLILLYSASTIYHFISKETKAKRIFQKIDHSMIYVLIAGTYTPICIAALGGAWGWSLFGAIWFLAALGIVWKSAFKMNKIISTIFYVIMGWLAVIAFIPLKSQLSPGALFWLFLGGLLYTLGAVIFSIESKFKKRKWFSLHDLWHVFVMAGSFAHFWLMFKYII